MLSVNTNVSSLTAQRNLLATGQSLSQSLERLSSGLRINAASDDAAGLAISDRMTAQVRGLNQAVRNANDGISLARTAEGALRESTNILQRIRVLSVQSASDTNTAADRRAMQAEVSQLQSELNRIADQTTFNRQHLLDGSFTARRFHIGSEADQTIAMSIGATRATTMGEHTLASRGNIGAGTVDAARATTAALAATGVVAQNLTVSGPAGTSAPLVVAASSSAHTIAGQINGVSTATGVSATASTSLTLGSVAAGAAGNALSFTLASRSAGTVVGTTASISVTLTSASDLTTLASAINAQTVGTGISATLSADRASLTLANSTGHDIVIGEAAVAGGAALGHDTFRVTGIDGGTGTMLRGGDPAQLDSIAVGGRLAFTAASAAFSVHTTVATTVFTIAANASVLSSVNAINIDSQAGANGALRVIDGALALIGSIRGELGAVQNRFQSTISNLMSVSENISAAQSRILDADFAAETANLTRAQILQQAGLAMLSQANQVPQAALALLQG